MSTSESSCPKCESSLSKAQSYSRNVIGDDYYFTYLRCEPCGQWYEEMFRDVFCGPDEVSLNAISEDEMNRRLSEKP